MSFAVTSHDYVLLTGYSGGSVYRKVPRGQSPTPVPTATSLLVTPEGSGSGEPNVETSPFVISANGLVPADVTVFLAWTGVTVSGAPTSAVLPAGTGTSVAVDCTPTASGTLTLTVSASGLTSAQATYTVASPAPVADFDLFAYKVADPEHAFGTDAGNNGFGVAMLPQFQMEFNFPNAPAAFKSIKTIDTESPSLTGLTYTATEIRRGNASVDAAFPIATRLSSNGRNIIRLRYRRNTHYWENATKWRAEFMMGGNTPWHPWGTRLWTVFGFYFSETQLKQRDDSWGDIMMQWHQIGGSLIRGGGFELQLHGSNGGPVSDAWISHKFTNYVNANWPAGGDSNDTQYIKTVYANPGSTAAEKSRLLTDVAVGENWFVMESVAGCGYPHAGSDGNVYGSVGTVSGNALVGGEEYYVKLYHATGSDGAPQIAVSRLGYWGGPHQVGSANANNNTGTPKVNQRDYKLKLGIYSSTSPGYGAVSNTDEATRDILGSMVIKHQDGMTPATVLAALRG